MKMSRPIQAGDLAIITVQGTEYPLPVISIDDNTIRIQDKDIVKINDKWQIVNYNLPHTISFKKPDNLCETQMRQDFGNIIQDLIPGYTCKTQYRRLSKLDEPSIPRTTFIADIIRNDRLDVLKNISSAGHKFTVVDAESAVREGKIPALAFFKDLGLTSYSIDSAVTSNNLELVKWVFANQIQSKVSEDAYYKAAIYDYTDMLNLLWDNNFKIGSAQVGEALANGADGDLMDWIVNKNIDLPESLPNLLLNSKQLNRDALDWLWDRGVRPSSEAITQLLKTADPKINWLLSKYTLQ